VNVWQVNGTDHATPEAAIAAVEARGHGHVIRFALERNYPGALPELVHRSSALWRFEQDTGWRRFSIFTGLSEDIGAGRPE
jgi:hypothetical protein